jgi:hypothetical protein
MEPSVDRRGWIFLTFTDFINTEGAFNVTKIELLDPPVDGYNFNATISVGNPTPFIVELVSHINISH